MSNASSGKEQIAKLTEAVLSRPLVSSLQPIPISMSSSVFTDFPAPTSDQIRDFVLYVSRAKSWYKHLSLWQPGEPFHFFLDPNAGLDPIFDLNGGYTHLERTSESAHSHYSWLTTKEHWERFGRLNFSCAAASRMYFPVSVANETKKRVPGLLDKNVDRATIKAEDLEFRLPDEVHHAGKAILSGVIHPDSSTVGYWQDQLKETRSSFSWPKDTGGQDTVNSILQICKTETSENLDTELDEVLKPERQRQVETMAKAIERMIAVIYG